MAQAPATSPGASRAAGRPARGPARRRPAMGRLLDQAPCRRQPPTRRATAASPRRNGRTTLISARSAIPICSPRSSCATWSSLGDGGDSSEGDHVSFLLDQYLNAVSPTNFALTNPGSDQAHQGNQRREPRPGFRQPPRGPRRAARASSSAAPTPTRSKRARRSPRRRARWCSRTICSS